MRNKCLIAFFPFLVSIFVPLCASADQAMQMLRVSCIPEANYFDIDVKYYHELVDFDDTIVVDGNKVKPSKRKGHESKMLAKYGIYFPRNFSYECKLSTGTIKIIGKQPMPSPSGQCGASPTPNISIWQDNVPWIENVLLGENCFGNPTITRIEIANGRMSLYINVSDNTLFDPVLFKYFMPGEIARTIPIKQESIQKIVESDYSYKKYKNENGKK